MHDEWHLFNTLPHSVNADRRITFVDVLLV